LFGSYARGTATKQSDIDLLFIVSDIKDKNLRESIERESASYQYSHNVKISPLITDIGEFKKMLKAKELNVLSDKFGTPCYTYDLARTIEYLITRKAYGLYHGACNGGGHRLDVARFIISKLGLEKKIKVNEVDSSYWQKEYFAPRPASERLTNIILKKLNPKLTRHWRICLAEYLERFDWLGKNI